MVGLYFVLVVTLAAIATAQDGSSLQEFTRRNNLFTAAVYKEVLREQEGQGNVLVSPFSVETVLALTQSGAKGQTAAEIRQGLGLPDSSEATESVYKQLLPHLKGNDKYSLNTANKIYAKKGYSLKEDFKQLARDVYQADVESIDFGLKDEAASTINQWVEQQTNNKIQGLIEPNNLSAFTRVILINALYFRGKWENAFEKFATTKKDFHRSARDVVQVDTMQLTENFNYYESPELGAKFLELPYRGEDASMVIVLPDAKDGLQSLEGQLERVFSAPKWTQERVAVALPKFTIETKIKFTEVLKRLGVKLPFGDQADLSGIGGKPGDLVISDVLQKAFINVTEAGTEAAAATAVIGVDRIGSFDYPPVKIFDFYVDHPALFYITFKDVGNLFVGRLVDPHFAE